MSETPRDTETTDSGAERRRTDRYDAGAMRWVSGLVSLLGLAIAAAPFLFETTATALWNNVVVGLAIFLIAGYNFYRMSRRYVPSTGSASLVAILGLWAIAAPFVIEYVTGEMAWTTIIAGALVALIAAYNVYASRRARTARRGARA